MVDQSLYSPINPHFFQPLLPGFHTHLNIPAAFFSKHLQGRDGHVKTAKLRTDASDKTWRVKMDGSKFTDGWADFAVAHDLRVGDIIVFRREGQLVFHVTALGPSCCEIQYTSSHNINNDQTNNIVIGSSPRENRKRVKKNPRKKVEPSSSHLRQKPVPQASLDSSCYVVSVRDSSLKYDKLYLGREFVTANGLHKGCSAIVLKNECGGRWTLPLKHSKSINHTYLGPGWRTFCQVNGIKAKDSFRFKLVGTGDKPVLSLCPTERTNRSKSHESKAESLGDKKNKRASPSYSEDRFVTLTLTQKAVKYHQQFLPRGFTKRNGINKPGKITLLGQDGVRRVVALSWRDKRTGQMQIGRGWRVFCDAHGVKVGQPFVLELIWEDVASPVLKFCTNLTPREDSCDV